MESGVDWRVVNGVWSGLGVVNEVRSGLEGCEWSLEWIGGL